MAAKQIFCRHVYKGYMERGAIRFLPVTDKQAGDTENTIGCADRSLPESVQAVSLPSTLEQGGVLSVRRISSGGG